MPIPTTAAEAVEFRPPALYKRDEGGKLTGTPIAGDPVVILVRVPTYFERDNFASALARAGIKHYSPKQIRQMMLAALAEDRTEEEFDKIRADMEELWQVTDEEKKTEDARLRRLAELMDVEEGQEPPPDAEIEVELAKIVPDMTMDNRKRAETVALQSRLMQEYPPLAEALADLTEQDVKRAWMQAEHYVAGWHGLPDQPVGNGKGGLQRAEAEYLRRKIGKEAWDELSDFITALHGLDGDEEKNLASLIGSMSAPIGSTPTESTAISDAGDSKGGPSTEIPEAESPKTTESSSPSTTSSETTTETSAATPTEEGSFTSQ